jgi:hypothetical protein
VALKEAESNGVALAIAATPVRVAVRATELGSGAAETAAEAEREGETGEDGERLAKELGCPAAAEEPLDDGGSDAPLLLLLLLLLGGVLDAVAPAELAALPAGEGASLVEPLRLELGVGVDVVLLEREALAEAAATMLLESEALADGVAAAMLLGDPLTVAEPLTLCKELLEPLALLLREAPGLPLEPPEPLLVSETDGDGDAELEVDGSTEADGLPMVVTELLALPVALPVALQVVLTLGVGEAAAGVRSVRLYVYCSGGEA